MDCERIQLYHGTSSFALGSILEKGLLPWEIAGFCNYGPGVTYRDKVFLVGREKSARYWAKNATNKRDGLLVVVRVSVAPDNLTGEFEGETFDESMIDRGSCAHIGVINSIEGYSIYTRDFEPLKVEEYPKPSGLLKRSMLFFNKYRSGFMESGG